MVVLEYYHYISLAILGLIFGSYLTSLTWRIGRTKFKIWQNRSICPNCKNPIKWFDNIPLLSFFLLKGKCRSCKKPISIRYPLIELSTALVFLLIGWMYNSRISLIIIMWRYWLGWVALIFFLIAAVILIAVFVVDFERLIIPDELVFLLSLSSVFLLFDSRDGLLFDHLFWAGAASTFVLGLNIITLGKGMGLGDAKLIMVLGLLTGESVVMIFFAGALLGAVVGLILIVFKRASFGRPVPFGPFLILATLVVMLAEDKIWELIAYGIQL